MKKIKNLIIVMMLLCTLGLTGCGSSVNDIVNMSMPFGAEVLSCVSMVNGTAIKVTNKLDNQLSVVYDNGDVLTYSTTMKTEKPSISFSMNYVASEKRSIDFIVGIIENILGDDFKDKLTNDMKGELNYAIENDSLAKLKFTSENWTVKIDFKQTGNIFSLCIKFIG